MMVIAASAPPGDLVEIGVLWGRSAFMLAWLARHYGIGSLLCIDPWTQNSALQFDSPRMVRQAVRDLNFDSIYATFKTNLLPSFGEAVNYLRDTSTNAAGRYGPEFIVGPTDFGSTQYTGAISILHIDGNHDYRLVSRDICDWTPRVVSGGWIVIDDYVWPFGDGPRRAADEFIHDSSIQFSCAFVADGALFVQKE